MQTIEFIIKIYRQVFVENLQRNVTRRINGLQVKAHKDLLTPFLRLQNQHCFFYSVQHIILLQSSLFLNFYFLLSQILFYLVKQPASSIYDRPINLTCIGLHFVLHLIGTPMIKPCIVAVFLTVTIDVFFFFLINPISLTRHLTKSNHPSFGGKWQGNGRVSFRFVVVWNCRGRTCAGVWTRLFVIN